jgi:hypothetical protein
MHNGLRMWNGLVWRLIFAFINNLTRKRAWVVQVLQDLVEGEKMLFTADKKYITEEDFGNNLGSTESWVCQ